MQATIREKGLWLSCAATACRNGSSGLCSAFGNNNCHFKFGSSALTKESAVISGAIGTTEHACTLYCAVVQ